MVEQVTSIVSKGILNESVLALLRCIDVAQTAEGSTQDYLPHFANTTQLAVLSQDQGLGIGQWPTQRLYAVRDISRQAVVAFGQSSLRGSVQVHLFTGIREGFPPLAD